MEEKLYLVIVDLYENEENSIVNICTSKEIAENLMEKYRENSQCELDYHIDEITIDYSKNILWDCYENSSFNITND